jgi:hypothetical protein
LPYREIAEELTNRNIPTPRGGEQWNAMSVMRASKDDARRMAQQILRLPELVRIAKGIDPSDA